MRVLHNIVFLSSMAVAVVCAASYSEQPRVTAYRSVELESLRVSQLASFLSLYVGENINFSGTFTELLSEHDIENYAQESFNLIHLFTEGGFVDSWGNPYDVIIFSNVVVVASGGPDSISFTKDDIVRRGKIVTAP
jgi:hypothetical protein